MRALKRAHFPQRKRNISRVFFYIEETIFPKRKWQTKITKKKINPISYNDHCSGLLQSEVGGSDNFVEHHLRNLQLPV